ncbi:hypothetical protein JTB14_007338 [Gonioctena quinquepunctata]|nr:hypothetical protein JTB14_007338 [Gonioctena quinquepunctata]
MPNDHHPPNEAVETDKFIKESTLGTIKELLQCEVVDDPGEILTGLGPDISSMGLANSLDDTSNAVQPTQEFEINLDFDDIDDKEIDTYIMSDTEFECKKKLWFSRNADFLEEQRVKAEKLQKERGEGKPEKKRKRTNKKKVIGPASSAGEAIEKIIQEKKISSKINYDVLKSLNTAPVQNDEVVSVDEETSAATSESIKRRRLSSISNNLEKVPVKGNKRNLKDVGLPFFDDIPRREMDKTKKKDALNKEVVKQEDEPLKKEEKADATSEDELDDYEEEDQLAEEPTNEMGVLQMLRQHREDEEGEDYGYSYYDETDY